MRSRRVLALSLVVGLLAAACVPLPVQVEPKPLAPTRAQTPAQSTATPIPATEAARVALATELGVAADEITILSLERVEWPDSCLGAAAEGEVCAQVITPGYRIVLKTIDKQYVAHTDESGKAVRLVTP
jgi:hypothetical protein